MKKAYTFDVALAEKCDGAVFAVREALEDLDLKYCRRILEQVITEVENQISDHEDEDEEL